MPALVTAPPSHERSAPGRLLSEATSEQLMTLAQRGDARAFEVLFDRHGAKAYAVARSVLWDETLAEDAVQEAFIGVWRKRDRYLPERGDFSPWLMQVVRLTAISVLRRETAKKRGWTQLNAIEHSHPASDDLESLVMERCRRGSIEAALAELPLEQREVIVLAFFLSMSHGDIARLLELPMGTVKGRIRLGMDKLRRSLASVAA